MGSDRLLHLHGLHDDDLVAFVDLFSLYDINLDDCSLHRAGHRVAGRCGAATGAVATGRSVRFGAGDLTSAVQGGGDTHLNAFTVDLDDDRRTLRRDLLGGYRYPTWLLGIGVLAWLLTLYLGIQSLGGLAKIWA